MDSLYTKTILNTGCLTVSNNSHCPVMNMILVFILVISCFPKMYKALTVDPSLIEGESFQINKSAYFLDWTAAIIPTKGGIKRVH